VQEVQQAEGDRAHIAGAVIPQDVVDFPDGAFIVTAGSAVTGVQTFSGVGVEERQASFRRGGQFGNGRF
jgi:hypothetical protein